MPFDHFHFSGLRPLLAHGPSGWSERVRHWRSPFVPRGARLCDRWPLLTRHKAILAGGALALCTLRLAGSGTAHSFSRREPVRLLPEAVSGPLAFEANVGQADRSVRFLSRARDWTVLVADGEWTIVTRGGERIRFTFRGADPGAAVAGDDPWPDVRRYRMSMLDETAAATVAFGAIAYRRVYPGVDLRLSMRPDGLRLLFRVDRGASAAPIRLATTGARVRSTDGEWHVGSFAVSQPLVGYQERAGVRQTVPVSLLAERGDGVALGVGSYDVREPLSIELALRADAQ